MSTKIEWTDETWNPVRGCSIVSKGCTNCYAMRQAHRQSGPGKAYEGLTMITKGGPVWTGKVRQVHELLDAPLHWRTPRRIFVNSMSDLFHDDVDEIFIGSVLGIASACPQHSFQVLTKRPQHMLDVLRSQVFLDAYVSSQAMYTHTETPWPASNVWLGVSVEDQVSADERIPLLLKTPAAVRWISAEPLLGPVDLTAIDAKDWDECYTVEDGRGRLNALTGWCYIEDLQAGRWEDVLTPEQDGYHGQGARNRAAIDWVVAGGESGYGARPMHPDWARLLRDQCVAAGTPFFFKQWGNWMEVDGAHRDPETGDHRLIEVPSIEAEDTFDSTSDCLITIDGKVFLSLAKLPINVPGRHMTRGPKKWCGRDLDGRTHDEYPA